MVLFIVTNRRLHSTANWFVLSLAVADFGVGVAIFPMRHLCSILTLCNKSVYVTLYWFLLHSPVTNLCILTSDRYINIVQPFRHPNSMTSKKPWNSHFYVMGNSFDHFAGYFGTNARYELIHNFKNLADNRSLSF